MPSPTATRPAATLAPAATLSPQEVACGPDGDPNRPSIVGAELFQLTKPGGLQAAVAAGVHWVRYGAFDWDRIEPERTDPPTYHWEAVDEAGLARAADLDLEVIAVVRFAPEWAQGSPGHACGPIDEKAHGAWVEFLSALVTRYSAPPYSIRYWELGNEPDIDSTLVGRRNIYGCWGNAEDEYYGGGAYAEMLKVAYPAIKAVDPTAQVLIGGLLLDCDPRDAEACQWGSHKDLPPRFLEGILVQGGGPYFDLVSFHAYAHYKDELGQMINWGWPGAVTSIPEKTAFLREVLQAYGYGDKGLMNTEAALLCKEPTPDCLETQALYVPRAYADALAAGLEAQIYFAVVNEHWYNTGLVYRDLTPKPAYQALVTASQFLGQAGYLGPLSGYPPGVGGYAFWRCDEGRHLDLIWSVDGEPLPVDLPSEATVYDRFGVAVPSAGALQVDYQPLYVDRP